MNRTSDPIEHDAKSQLSPQNSSMSAESYSLIASMKWISLGTTYAPLQNEHQKSKTKNTADPHTARTKKSRRFEGASRTPKNSQMQPSQKTSSPDQFIPMTIIQSKIHSEIKQKPKKTTKQSKFERPRKNKPHPLQFGQSGSSSNFISLTDILNKDLCCSNRNCKLLHTHCDNSVLNDFLRKDESRSVSRSPKSCMTPQRNKSPSNLHNSSNTSNFSPVDELADAESWVKNDVSRQSLLKKKPAENRDVTAFEKQEPKPQQQKTPRTSQRTRIFLESVGNKYLQKIYDLPPPCQLSSI